MKNKGLRKFYENQNDRLNDWLEVDAIVTAVADDVLESMDPDPDNDGDQERGGGLQSMGGNIYAFLPDEEKERREKSEWKAKWAININVIANIILLIAKIVAHGATRAEALERLAVAVDETRIEGVKTNLDLHRMILKDEAFRAGGIDIHHLERLLRDRAATR